VVNQGATMLQALKAKVEANQEDIQGMPLTKTAKELADQAPQYKL
jgi:hypothetical protein